MSRLHAIKRGKVGSEFLQGCPQPHTVGSKKLFRSPAVLMTEHLAHLSTGFRDAGRGGGVLATVDVMTLRQKPKNQMRSART